MHRDLSMPSDLVILGRPAAASVKQASYNGYLCQELQPCPYDPPRALHCLGLARP